MEGILQRAEVLLGSQVRRSQEHAELSKPTAKEI